MLESFAVESNWKPHCYQHNLSAPPQQDQVSRTHTISHLVDKHNTSRVGDIFQEFLFNTKRQKSTFRRTYFWGISEDIWGDIFEGHRVLGEDILGDTLDGILGGHFGGHFGWFVILKFIDKLKLGETSMWCYHQERTEAITGGTA